MMPENLTYAELEEKLKYLFLIPQFGEKRAKDFEVGPTKIKGIVTLTIKPDGTMAAKTNESEFDSLIKTYNLKGGAELKCSTVYINIAHPFQIYHYNGPGGGGFTTFLTDEMKVILGQLNEMSPVPIIGMNKA